MNPELFGVEKLDFLRCRQMFFFLETRPETFDEVMQDLVKRLVDWRQMITGNTDAYNL